MSAWKSRGLRGDIFEELINRSNTIYLRSQLALVQKISTPITPVTINDKGQITLAYFDSKSTVDYIGAVQGIPICFDAKECTKPSFALRNIHTHQLSFMKSFEIQGGISFLLIYYVNEDKVYYLRLSELTGFFDRMDKGGKKSFVINELDQNYFMKFPEGLVPIPYLKLLQKDINERMKE